LNELEIETALVVAALYAVVQRETDVAIWGLLGEVLRGPETDQSSLQRRRAGQIDAKTVKRSQPNLPET
jgi:hypothetical protein